MKNTLSWICILLCFGAFSQDDDNRKDSIETDDFYIDFSVPDITAFSILDIEPSTISRPGSVKEFAMGLTNFVSKSGELRPGLAVEWAPFKTFNKDVEKWEAKTPNRLKFEWKNWLISGATTSDSSNVKLAAGLKFAPLDRTNPLNDPLWVASAKQLFLKEMDNRRSVLDQAQLPTKIPEYNQKRIQAFTQLELPMQYFDSLFGKIEFESSYMEEVQKELEESGTYDRSTVANYFLSKTKELFVKQDQETAFETYKDSHIMPLCRELTDLFYAYNSTKGFAESYGAKLAKMKQDYKKKHWNKLALQFSGGLSMNSETTQIEDLAQEYWGGALTIAMPLIGKNWFKKHESFHNFMRNNSQIIGQVKASNYFVQDSTLNNSIFAGCRILLGNSDKRFSAEVAYVKLTNALTDLNAEGVRYTIGAELKIMDNYWLEFAVGGQSFEDQTGVFILPKFGFRHSFGNENRFFKD